MGLEEVIKEWIAEAVRTDHAQALNREEQMVKLYGEYVSRTRAMKIIGCGRKTLEHLLDTHQLIETDAGIRVRDIANLPAKRRKQK